MVQKLSENQISRLFSYRILSNFCAYCFLADKILPWIFIKYYLQLNHTKNK